MFNSIEWGLWDEDLSILVKWWILRTKKIHPECIWMLYLCYSCVWVLHSRVLKRRHFFAGLLHYSPITVSFPHQISCFSCPFHSFVAQSWKISLFLHNSHRNCSITNSKGVAQKAKWNILVVTGTLFAFWPRFLAFFVKSLLLWWPQQLFTISGNIATRQCSTWRQMDSW